MVLSDRHKCVRASTFAAFLSIRYNLTPRSKTKESLIQDLRAQNFLRLRRAENGASALDSAPEPLTETTPLPSTPATF